MPTEPGDTPTQTGAPFGLPGHRALIGVVSAVAAAAVAIVAPIVFASIWTIAIAGIALLVMLLATQLVYRDLPISVPTTEDQRNESQKNFDWHVVGLSFAMFAFAAVSLGMFVGLLLEGGLDYVAHPPAADPPANTLTGPKAARFLWLSGILSCVGVCFHIVRRMRSNRQAGEQFIPMLFWHGIWFRFGQAIIYTLVVFLMIWGFADAEPPQPGKRSQAVTLYGWLPILALFLGMFVRTGETLIGGLADRVFQAASVLLGKMPTTPPIDDLTPQPPSPPPPSPPTKPEKKKKKKAKGKAKDDAKTKPKA